MKTAEAELQALHEERQAQETMQEHLEQVQAEDQELKKEKEQLLAKVEELEEQQKIMLSANDMHSQDLRQEHQEQISSLLQPLKEHILVQKARILQLYIALEEERCKVLPIDNRLGEIMETSSYFVDRSQDALEVLNARMARLENNAETTARLPSKDHHDLIEFAVRTTEDFKKTVKRTQGAC